MGIICHFTIIPIVDALVEKSPRNTTAITEFSEAGGSSSLGVARQTPIDVKSQGLGCVAKGKIQNRSYSNFSRTVDSHSCHVLPCFCPFLFWTFPTDWLTQSTRRLRPGLGLRSVNEMEGNVHGPRWTWCCCGFRKKNFCFAAKNTYRCISWLVLIELLQEYARFG